MRAFADSALARSQYYTVRFDSTENYNYDDGRVFFENYYYSFNDNILILLPQGNMLRESYEIKNLWANKLLYKLIKLDPVTYSASIEKERVVVTSDESWKYSNTYYPEQWTRAEFDDSDWKFAQVVPSGYNQFFDLGYDPQAIWVRTAPLMVETDTSATADTSMAQGDTLAVQPAFSDTTSNLGLEEDPFAATGDTVDLSDPFAADTMMAETGTESSTDTLVFFRKGFVLDGTPVSGEIYVTADDDYRIYLNGEYLIDDAANNYAVIDTLDYYTIEYFIQQGENLLAIDVEDMDLTGGGLKFYGFFEILPSDITAAAEERSRVKEIQVDPVVLRKVNILNKNRISSNR
jgi:hypothetical protein